VEIAAETELPITGIKGTDMVGRLWAVVNIELELLNAVSLLEVGEDASACDGGGIIVVVALKVLLASVSMLVDGRLECCMAAGPELENDD
jgi:hypothetical protein